MLLSLPLLWGRIPPNGMFGFRVQATLENPSMWNPANKYAAERLLWSGPVFVAAAVVLCFISGIGVDTYSLGCLFLFAVLSVMGLIQSPLRQSPGSPVPLEHRQLLQSLTEQQELTQRQQHHKAAHHDPAGSPGQQAARVRVQQAGNDLAKS